MLGGSPNDIVQAQTTIFATTYGNWIDLGNGLPYTGANIAFIVNGITGNPDVLFKTQYSDDQAAIFDGGIDPQGPVNVLGQRVLHVHTRRRYMRYVAMFNTSDPGESSGNSSSLSGQSFAASSSGGAAATSMSFNAAFCGSANG